jgi:hypothetical protein
MPEQDLRRSFSAAIKFHALRTVRSQASMQDACEPWFKRLFDAAEDALLLEWLPELLQFPLFDHVETPRWRRECSAWPDPMNDFPGGRAEQARKDHPELLTKIHAAVDWLLSRTPSETGEAWQRAMIRLLNVSSNGLLTSEQNKLLGEQVWGRRGPNGLPQLTNVSAVGYILRFPIPAGIDAVSMVRNHVTSATPVHASVGSNGEKVGGISLGWRQQFLHEVIVSSKPIISFTGEELRGIEWAPDEANCFYEKAHSWIETDKCLIQTKEQRKGNAFFPGNPLLNEAQKLDEF